VQPSPYAATSPSSPPPATTTGSVYIFRRGDDGLWHQSAKLTAPDGAYDDRLGWSVATNGDFVFAGAYHADVDGVADAGAIYVFAIGPDTDSNGVPDPCQCPGDANDDGVVSLPDLAVVLIHFGTPAGMTRPNGDLDSDADVDLADLATLLTNFGETCP
jgi:FG-GAP repeat